jgi:hypothetical protein
MFHVVKLLSQLLGEGGEADALMHKRFKHWFVTRKGGEETLDEY